MTPQLQQAIKLLQMSRLELVDMVREELMENPVLEDQAEIGEVSPRVAEVPQPSQQESRSIEQAVALDDRASEKSVAGEEKKVEEIDWERYLENHAMQAPLPSSGRMSDEDLPGVEATLSKREDLAEHIAWQVRLSDLTENELAFAALVVGNLDENGYLKLEDTPLEEVVPKLAAEAEMDPEDAEEVLKIIQRMDPVGVASRDLRECLMGSTPSCSRCSTSTCPTSRRRTTRRSPATSRWRSRRSTTSRRPSPSSSPAPGATT
jgi:RNA polymerase sigma-54 factor